MAALFCLRLAFGQILPLWFLPTSIVHPRFFRVQYLTSLGLLGVAGFFLRNQADGTFWLLLGSSLVLCFAGSVVWHLDEFPGHRLVLFAGTPLLLATLVVGGIQARNGDAGWLLISDDLTSGAFLGATVACMLMGHSYLLAPAMSIQPLMRLLGLLACSLAARLLLAGAGLWLWTASSASISLETETLLWLSARWILGFVSPLCLTWMAWETARIRSTQSATGILYVVVIVGFLGELTSLLLVDKTHYLL